MNLVTHPDQAQWLDPAKTGNPARIGHLADAHTMTFYRQELPPHSAGDLQRHAHESVHCVLEGSGYSEIGAETVRWTAGDLVYTPPWAWHRHYNDGDAPVRMLLVENSPLVESLGLFARESAGEVSIRDARIDVGGSAGPDVASVRT